MPWRLVNRHGVHAFKKVDRFIHELDLVKLTKEIIALARKVWDKVVGDGRVFMLITLTFAVMGDGHPFYPDAFIESDRVNFVIRNLQIYDIKDIDREVAALIREIYEIDIQVSPLYLEHYEVSKSAPND